MSLRTPPTGTCATTPAAKLFGALERARRLFGYYSERELTTLHDGRCRFARLFHLQQQLFEFLQAEAEFFLEQRFSRFDLRFQDLDLLDDSHFWI